MRRHPIDHAMALFAHFWMGYCLERTLEILLGVS